MFYDNVEFIFDELESLTDENKLIENLKLIAYSSESSKPEDVRIYFREILDIIRQLTENKENECGLCIISSILLFLKELKNSFPNVFNDKEFFKSLSIFFSYIEKILKSEYVIKNDAKKRDEVILVLQNSFAEEYYYRKDNRLNPIQYNLPF